MERRMMSQTLPTAGELLLYRGGLYTISHVERKATLAADGQPAVEHFVHFDTFVAGPDRIASRGVVLAGDCERFDDPAALDAFLVKKALVAAQGKAELGEWMMERLASLKQLQLPLWAHALAFPRRPGQPPVATQPMEG